MGKISVSSHHHALDQRSFETATSMDDFMTSRSITGAKRFHRLRYAGCDDCVCIEEASHECSFPKESKCRKRNAHKYTIDSYERGRLLT